MAPRKAGSAAKRGQAFDIRRLLQILAHSLDHFLTITMKFPAVLLCFAATAWGAEPQRRDATATESGYNMASLSSALSVNP